MFAERLKEERMRLEMNQNDFAKSCGVKRNAQIKYEKSERNPDSNYLEKAHEIGVDVSYLITGKRTQPVELPSDEALLLESYRALDVEEKKMSLRFWLGGLGSLQADKNTNADNTDSAIDSPNSNNDDSAINSPNSNNENSVINSPNSNNTNSVIGSPNSNNTNSVVGSPNAAISNSFNTQSGFTELPFIYSCGFFGAMAWLLGALASWKAATDMAVSMSFGQVALILWAMTIVMAIFGHSIGKKKYDEVQANNRLKVSHG